MARLTSFSDTHQARTPSSSTTERGRQFTPIMFGEPKGAAYGFALGDINRDKFPDIALARSGAPNVLYLSGK